MKRDSSLRLRQFLRIPIAELDVRVDELDADTKRCAHTLQRQRAITFEQLCVCKYAHLSYVVTSVGVEDS